MTLDDVQVRERRAAVARQKPGTVPLGQARSVGFPSAFAVRTVQRDGQDVFQLTGTATAYGRLYDMWDAFGSYREGVRAFAGRDSLAAGPDVAFLTNHRGITMARTTNRSLELSESDSGLNYDAFLNPKRQDVQTLVTAITDRLVTESSFAFMIDEGEWNDDFSEFWITRYDINRGDVSAVNYGANPYTSVAARSREILADLEHLPAGARLAAYEQLAATVRPAPPPAPEPEPEPQGRSIALINLMLLAESGEQ
jgi:HK97 family phage prohead protease